MTAFEAYCKYVALKLHFNNEKYDYYKFNGKSRTSVSKFETRSDRYFFEKLVKKYSDVQIEEIFFSNFIRDKSFWIGTVFDANNNYSEFKKITDSITKTFQEEIEKLHNKNNDLNYWLKCHDNELPHIVWKVLHKETPREIFLILDQLLGITLRVDKKFKDNYVWNTFKLVNQKYSTFFCRTINLQNNKKTYIQILKKQFIS